MVSWFDQEAKMVELVGSQIYVQSSLNHGIEVNESNVLCSFLCLNSIPSHAVGFQVPATALNQRGHGHD
jgi:hypothetical protein